MDRGGNDVARPEAEARQVVPVTRTTLPVGVAASPLDYLSEAELAQLVDRQVLIADTIKKLMMVAVRLTYGHDWVDFGGKPYLEGEGAQRLLAPMGIDVDEPRFTVQEVGGHTFVLCSLRGTWRKTGNTLVEIGGRDTLDDFFVGDRPEARTQYNQYLEAAGGDHNVARAKLMAYLQKSAYMNAMSRLVGGLLGLRGLKWDDLRAMGLTPEKAGARVKFDAHKIVDDDDASEQPEGPAQGTAAKREAPARRAPAKRGAKKEVQDMTIAELLLANLGTRAHITGTLAALHQFAKLTRWTIADADGAVVEVVEFGEPAEYDWAVKGAAVEVPSLRVNEYQGKTQFIAEDGVEPIVEQPWA